MKFISLLLFLSFTGASAAKPDNAETFKAIEAASKDFKNRIVAMYPASGEYSALRDLESYSMGIARTPSKIVIVFPD